MNHIPWQNMLDMSAFIIVSVLLLSSICLPILIITGQIQSILKERSAYAKCAKQMTQLTVILSWALCLMGIAVLYMRLGPALLAGLNPNISTEIIPIDLALLFTADPNMVHIQMDLIVWLNIFIASIVMSILYVKWSLWEEQRILHHCLYIFCTFWYAFATYAIICALNAENAASIGITYPASLEALLSPNFETNVWYTIPYLIPLSFSLAASVSTVWLILRRNKDDFGRDYYSNMLKWCAKSARKGWAVLWILFFATTAFEWFILLQDEKTLPSTYFLHSALKVLLWIVPGVLWTIVLRSETPLRHKMTLVLAFFLSFGIIMPIYTSFNLL